MSERQAPSAIDVAIAANDWATGLGIMTIAIFPLAIPLLALTALAAALLLVPAVPLVLLILPLWLARRVRLNRRRRHGRRTSDGASMLASTELGGSRSWSTPST